MSGEPAVTGVAGEGRVVAEIFLAAGAVVANAADPPSQGTPTRSPTWRFTTPGPEGFDPSDNFMTGRNRKWPVGQIAIDDVKIGPADGAGFDPHERLARRRRGRRALFHHKRRSSRPKDHGLHAALEKLPLDHAGVSIVGMDTATGLRENDQVGDGRDVVGDAFEIFCANQGVDHGEHDPWRQREHADGRSEDVILRCINGAIPFPHVATEAFVAVSLRRYDASELIERDLLQSAVFLF